MALVPAPFACCAHFLGMPLYPEGPVDFAMGEEFLSALSKWMPKMNPVSHVTRLCKCMYHGLEMALNMAREVPVGKTREKLFQIGVTGTEKIMEELHSAVKEEWQKDPNGLRRDMGYPQTVAQLQPQPLQHAGLLPDQGQETSVQRGSQLLAKLGRLFNTIGRIADRILGSVLDGVDSGMIYGGTVGGVVGVAVGGVGGGVAGAIAGTSVTGPIGTIAGGTSGGVVGTLAGGSAGLLVGSVIGGVVGGIKGGIDGAIYEASVFSGHAKVVKE